MKIRVRRKHIQKGCPGSGRRCPIALALLELLGDDPIVGPICADVADKRYELPRSARRFIARFDYKKPVKPFVFTLKVAAKQ